jgi:hypothetical protein
MYAWEKSFANTIAGISEFSRIIYKIYAWEKSFANTIAGISEFSRIIDIM